MSNQNTAEITLPPSQSVSVSDDVTFERPTQITRAWQDIVQGVKTWRVWYMLAYQDIKLRYRRSIIGPFWLTISMAITVYSMGFLYAHLFHIPLEDYFPFLVAGMLSWSLISTAVTELTDALTGSDTLIKQIKLPYTLHIHRIAWRNILIFFHNIFVLVPVFILYRHHVKINLNTLLIIPGLIVTYVNSVAYGVVLAMIGARYRDVSQIIKSLVQVIFFVTPVMWAPNVLKGKLYILDYNPFYAFIEIIRQPILGHVPNQHILLMVAFMTLGGCLMSFTMLARYRSRIVYWL